MEDLVDITLLAARTIQRFGITPRIAMLSYSNFGSNSGEEPIKVRDAVEFLHKNHPEIIVDGEIQANFATNPEILKKQFPFSDLVDQNVNTLIFPNLSSGNMAYKLLFELGGAEIMGPILLGTKKTNARFTTRLFCKRNCKPGNPRSSASPRTRLICVFIY
jgi:malate dehydrogenase (oxaloacetate-decarboxylating)(NADP+)